MGMRTFLFLLWVFTLNASALQIIEKKITVNGKEATVLGIAQPDGTLGLTLRRGEIFDVDLTNTLNVPTSIHWHGLILPNNQDGVAFITQLPIYPGLTYHYQFPLVQAGTYWMHSHYSLQEQRQLSAPLILKGYEDDNIADQEVVIFFSDFSFRSPQAIYENLLTGKKMGDMNMPDIVEVDYDAFLANYATLENPFVAKVGRDQKIRLRIINGASATNFHIDLGKLQGAAIAVDGEYIKPIIDSRFELSVAQRIDIVVVIPKEGGAFPILAQGEGTTLQTGIILKTDDAQVPKLSSRSNDKAPPLTNAQERKLEALEPLTAKKIDRSLTVELGGDMENYTWTLNKQSWPNITPLQVKKDERVEIIFKNTTTMSHPMHLHGHVFQVTAINDEKFKGAKRDTVLVMPNSSLTIEFNADNPGVWPLHCHILYHLEAGMLTTLRYRDYVQQLPVLKKN